MIRTQRRKGWDMAKRRVNLVTSGYQADRYGANRLSKSELLTTNTTGTSDELVCHNDGTSARLLAALSMVCGLAPACLRWLVRRCRSMMLSLVIIMSIFSGVGVCIVRFH